MPSWTDCSRFRLFTNCTPLNPTICFILPDRDITKIAETILVSAICLILPFGFVTPEGLEPSTQWLRVICSTNWATESCCFGSRSLRPLQALKGLPCVLRCKVTALFLIDKIFGYIFSDNFFKILIGGVFRRCWIFLRVSELSFRIFLCTFIA